jgi:peroxiredoxin
MLSVESAPRPNPKHVSFALDNNGSTVENNVYMEVSVKRIVSLSLSSKHRNVMRNQIVRRIFCETSLDKSDKESVKKCNTILYCIEIRNHL